MTFSYVKVNLSAASLAQQFNNSMFYSSSLGSLFEQITTLILSDMNSARACILPGLCAFLNLFLEF